LIFYLYLFQSQIPRRAGDYCEKIGKIDLISQQATQSGQTVTLLTSLVEGKLKSGRKKPEGESSFSLKK